MYPRTQYEMTESDLATILDACRPVPLIMLQCGTPSSPQENANRAWKELGARMGFDYETVEPIQGKSNRFFTAVPSETEFQRTERVNKELAEERRCNIILTQQEIARLQNKLDKLVEDARTKP